MGARSCSILIVAIILVVVIALIIVEIRLYAHEMRNELTAGALHSAKQL